MTTVRFPDTKRAVRDLLKRFGTTYLQLTGDYAEHLPGILVYRVGGTEAGPFRTDRIAVEVYDWGLSATDDLAERVKDYLLSGPHDLDDDIVIDRVTLESSPTDVPQPENWPAMSQATYRVSVRGTR